MILQISPVAQVATIVILCTVVAIVWALKSIRRDEAAALSGDYEERDLPVDLSSLKSELRAFLDHEQCDLSEKQLEIVTSVVHRITMQREADKYKEGFHNGQRAIIEKVDVEGDHQG